MSLLTKISSYYKLDGNSNDSCLVSNGTDTAITYSVGNGKISQGGGFNGTSSKIALNRTAYSPSQGSLSCWVNFNVVATTSRPIADITGHLYFELDGLKRMIIAVYNAGGYSITAPTASVINTWYFLVATWGGGLLKLYINNVLIGSISCPGPASVTNLVLGNITSYYLNGKIDEVGIWNDALTATEVNSLYNGGLGLSYPFSNSNFLAFFQ